MRTTGQLAVALLLFYLSLRTKAYVARGYTDTSNGYCEGDYGKIPVNGTGYNDERCESVLCEEGMYIIEGCGVVMIADLPANCYLVGKPGHYPYCCKTNVQCDNDDGGSTGDNEEDCNGDNGEDSNGDNEEDINGDNEDCNGDTDEDFSDSNGANSNDSNDYEKNPDDTENKDC